MGREANRRTGVGEAPGRICLLGEHCDWAGGESLVVPMAHRVRVALTPADRLSARTDAFGGVVWKGDGDPGDSDPGFLRFVPAVAAVVGERWGLPETGAVAIASDLPPGRGFSSSAALSVALVRAWLSAYKIAATEDEVADAAYRAEHDRLGVACGRLDQLACAYATPLRLSFGAKIVAKRVPVRSAMFLAVGAFPAPRDTPGILRALSDHVAGNGRPDDVAAVKDAIARFGRLVQDGEDALGDGDVSKLGAAMDEAQEAYERSFERLPALQAPGLRAAVRLLRAHGAAGAKFSGAGGDGSVIGLFSDAEGAARGCEGLREMGLGAFEVRV